MNPAPPELSIIIPCHNEEGNLRALTEGIRAALKPLAIEYEIVVTDDGSTDNSWALLKELASIDSRLRVQRFAGNCGESAASWAGMQRARGRYLVTMDADLHNDRRYREA